MGLRSGVSFLSIILLLSCSYALASVSEFPGRLIYSTIPYIELGDFYKRRDEVVIVDVRSAYEYNTLKINSAINIPLASKGFTEEMQALRREDKRTIVVYCNGKTCMKSYKAARKAARENIDNVVVFDAGVFDWAKNYPNHATLLGKTLKDPKKLISSEQFAKHLITPDSFGDRVANGKTIVLDVRDRFQREGLSLFVGREYRVNLDDNNRLRHLVNKARRNGKTLLVYDAAGKQVRWLQYHLKNIGVKNYYFMKGGVRAYFDDMKQDFN